MGVKIRIARDPNACLFDIADCLLQRERQITHLLGQFRCSTLVGLLRTPQDKGDRVGAGQWCESVHARDAAPIRILRRNQDSAASSSRQIVSNVSYYLNIVENQKPARILLKP